MQLNITTNISNHPSISSIKRTATVTDITVNAEVDKAYIKLQICHFIQEGEELKPVSQLNKKIQLTLDNTAQVPVSPETPEITKGDYDVFADRVMAGESFVSVVVDGILLGDYIGKINEKMAY